MKIDGLKLTIKNGSQEIKIDMVQDGSLRFEFIPNGSDTVQSVSVKPDVLTDVIKFITEHSK